MSEFPELEDFSGATTSGDPTSDFLARERELLGDEFGGVPENYEVPTVTTGDDQYSGFGKTSELIGSNNHQTNSIQLSLNVNDGVGDDLVNFQDQYPDLSHDVPSSPQANGFGGPAQSLYANQSSPYATPNVYAHTQDEEESVHIKEWRKTQQEEIRQRDERSTAKREETIIAAEKAIDDFYKGYNSQKEKNIARNKEQEASYLQSRDDQLGKGTTWERIADIIELVDSRSKTCGKSNRDLSRFKEVLLSLKREGENAPGAAGY
ncbi:clathrin light chain [Phakopsora pachyrhizi]|uniref:Clathrin light chain n=1 Tax=Phakopsora pachyrhizi TaxID=170000 RepID=A0AAV0BKT7_PHAPC|nr:clathrin light chain [Phakopsora pachyrhizi]